MLILIIPYIKDQYFIKSKNFLLTNYIVSNIIESKIPVKYPNNRNNRKMRK